MLSVYELEQMANGQIEGANDGVVWYTVRIQLNGSYYDIFASRSFQCAMECAIPNEVDCSPLVRIVIRCRGVNVEIGRINYTFLKDIAASEAMYKFFKQTQ